MADVRDSPGVDSKDPEEFAELMNVVASGIEVDRISRRAFRGRAITTELPGIGVFQARLTNGRIRTPLPRDYFAITTLQSGAVEIRDQRITRSYDIQDAHILHPDRALDLRSDAASPMLVATLKSSELIDFARKLTGRKDAGNFDFASRLSMTTTGGESFRRILNFVWVETNRRGTLLKSPLVYQEVSDLMREAFLHLVWREEAFGPDDRSNGCVASIRRAEDFIDAHLAEPMSLAQLADVAGISASTLNRGFRKRHGMAPKAFVKSRRLARTREALQDADPRTDTITDIAARYGFFHMSQFAADYKREFGELPSETLSR